MVWRPLLSLPLLLGILSGCSAPGSLREVEPLKADLAPYKHLTIHVSSPDRDLRDSLPGFSQRLAVKLKKEKVFPHVTQGSRRGSEGDIQLTLDFLKSKIGEPGSPYRATCEVIRSRDQRRLARLEIPGDDYGVVAAKEPLIRSEESIVNRISRYLKAHR